MTCFKILKQWDNPDSFWLALQKLTQVLPYFESSYSRSSLAFYKSYWVQSQGSNSFKVKDLSSIITIDEIPFFGFIGYLLETDSKTYLNAFQVPGICIEALNLSRQQSKIIRNFLDNEILNQSAEVTLKDPLISNQAMFSTDHLMFKSNNFKYQFKFRRHINLLDSEEAIKSRLRERFKSLINSGLRDFDISLHYGDNIDFKVIQAFRDLHIKEAGRETRSIDTWKKQFEAIKCKEAFCLVSCIDEEIVSAGYFSVSDRHCYYGSSASRRDMFDKPLFHAIMWKAILFAKSIGACVFDTGEDYCISNFSDTSTAIVSEKEKNIANFKAGFGGKIVSSIIFNSHFC